MITATNRIAAQIQQKTQLEARVCVPGHMLRGGSPSAYDRILATQFGVYAAQLIKEEHYGMTVAKVGGTITANPLAEIAGKTKFVTPDDQLVATARSATDFHSSIPSTKRLEDTEVCSSLFLSFRKLFYRTA